MFSIMAIVAMAATSVPTATLGAASYSDELQGAYDYAYGIGITTQSSIDSANMYGSLIRAHMAKMMVNYATEVLGKTPDTSATCNFTDVANQSDELKGYITEACQLGLMGVGITAFNPNGVVTRAQFGTVLSRALYGDIYNDGDPYYVNHLNALKDAGIMTNISNPNAPEVRGYVMLMMQRADEGTTTPAVCTTPENVLSCSLGLSTCPTECAAVQQTKAGTLTVSTVGANYTSVPAVGYVKFATVTFKAGSEDVNVYGVTFEKQGLSDVAWTKLYFEKDGGRISSKASFSQNKATVAFSTALVVKAGGSETVDLYAILSGAAAAEYQFGSTYVDSSAATVDGTIVTPLMRTIAYNIAGLTMTKTDDTASFKVNSTKLVELGQFNFNTFTNRTDKDLTFKAITLTNNGSSDLSYLSDLGLYRDDIKVSTNTTVNGRNVSFTLDDTIASTSSSTIYYVVKGKITNADRVGDTYKLSVRYPENTTVEEVGTNFKTSITNGTTALDLSTITINGGDVKFNQPSMSYTKDVVPGTLAVVFYSGTITSLEPITLENPALNYVSTISGGTDVLRTIYFKVGSTVLSADAPATKTGLVTFDGTVTINWTVPVSVYADVKDTAVAQSVKFTDTIGLDTFLGTNEYNSNGQVITSSIGTLSPITNNISAASLQMTNTYSNAQNVQKGDRDLKLADLKFSTTTDVISKISSFKATLSGSTWTNFQGGTVTVYNAAGTALVSDTIVSGTNTITFVLPDVVNVSKTTPVVFTLKLDQVSNVVASPNTLQLVFNASDVVARNFITNTNITPTASAVSSVLTTVAAGTVTNVATSFSPKLVQLDGSTVSLGTVKFTPYNGNAYLKNMYISLTGSNTNMYTELTLKDSGSTVATFMDSGSTPYFTNLSAPALVAGDTKTYDIVATLKTASTAANLSTGFKIRLTSAGFESMNGIVITGTVASPTLSSTIEFVKAKPTVSYVTSTKGGNAVYKFRVAANGGDIKIDTLELDIGNNTSATTATGTLYLGNEGSTPLGTVSISSGANLDKSFANLSGLVSITNGTYQDFTLVFPVSTWYAGTVNGNVGIEVSNISYYDTFTDGTTLLHADMFDSYKWDIAPVSTLITLQ